MKRDRLMMLISTAGGIISTLFTATFMPWATWVSKEIVQHKVDVAVIKEKIHLSPEDYASFSKTPASKEIMAFPALPFLPKTEENK